MAMRQIVVIDAERCDGCGQCVASCAEGAIALIDGKARLVKDEYCDGLGACLGECPRGAITITAREAAPFDAAAVAAHPAADPEAQRSQPVPCASTEAPAGGGCPGMMMRQFADRRGPDAPRQAGLAAGAPSALRQWPVQLQLVSPTAPYFREADLLLAADCTAFACADFHACLLAGHALVIACPKLDATQGYVEKLTALLAEGGVRSITIAMMEVPCCRGLEQLVAAALRASGRSVPVRRVIVGIEGDIV